MTTALVTGAAGFIGSHLVEGLLERGYDVRGLDNLSSGSLDNLSEVRDDGSFTFVEGDIRDSDVVARLVEGVDYVFHQAAVASVQQSFEDPAHLSDVNCTGTATLLSAAQSAAVRTVVLASSAAVYGSTGSSAKREDDPLAPESPYASSKRYTEELAVQLTEQSSLDIVALRYFNVFGPRQDPQGEYAAVIPKFIDLMLGGDRPVIYGDGEQSRDFVYIEDVVQANLLAIDGEPGIYNVATGSRSTINELVAHLNSILERDIEPEYAAARPGEVRHSLADILNVEQALGYEPKVTFESGLRQTVEAFQEQ